jgi:hypothetical protein
MQLDSTYILGHALQPGGVNISRKRFKKKKIKKKVNTKLFYKI